MHNSSVSSRRKALLLVPFGYFAATRLHGLRDAAYLVASSWVPAMWLAWRLGTFGPGQVAIGFAAGYLCFIAVYELGYLGNDAWDAHRDTNGRPRLGFAPGWLFYLTFAAVRLALWAAIGHLFG